MNPPPRVSGVHVWRLHTLDRGGGFTAVGNGKIMEITLSPGSIEDYRKFLRIKQLPRYSFTGRTAEFPDEYAATITGSQWQPDAGSYSAPEWMYDYQRDITAMALRKGCFAGFIDCGWGKTPIEFEFARHASTMLPKGRCVLTVAPLMVVEQMMEEAERFYGGSYPLKQIKANELKAWLASGEDAFGITNYEALDDSVEPGRLGGLILDESSMLKSHYGKWGQDCLRLGRGLRWKLAMTGTPAPNDRIEYANHAVFMDAFPTVNSFLARFFVNRGETQNRWELKPHALRPFYAALSHWSIFLTNPATYGWHDNCGTIPPIHVHIHNVDLTSEQRAKVMERTGNLVVTGMGGICSRSTLGQIAKGKGGISTNKPAFIRSLVDSWPTESTIIWCKYNEEQELLAKFFPDAASMDGSTPMESRKKMIADFKAGKVKVLISKAKVLGFGLNLQIATRQIFSGLEDSYETYYQAVKRSNRIGSTKPLNVHIPVTEIERPMIETVLAKAKRVQQDAEEQEAIFKECRTCC